jgi:ribosomal protein S18 acetylase RimI-like enzyme/N-acetylglutamate synthase-like GNAT family acetyltransferase
MTVQIRSFTDKDLSSLVKLLNKTHGESYEFIPFNEEKIRSQICERNLKILVAEEKGGIIGSVAYNNGHWGEEIEWLCVLENPNRKRLEKLLVREIEKHVKGEKIFTVVDAEKPKIKEWGERGYKPEGGLYHMVAKLDGLKPLPKVPEDVIFCSLKPEEEKDFVEAVNSGFGRKRLKQDAIQKWKSECPPFNEEWIHIAKLDNKIVSVVVSRPDVKYNKFFGGKRGYLGPAVTLPEYRSKNLASALTRRAMNSLFEKGMNPVALYTSERNIPSVTLLRKLGFKIGHNWKFMHKNLSQQC